MKCLEPTSTTPRRSHNKLHLLAAPLATVFLMLLGVRADAEDITVWLNGKQLALPQAPIQRDYRVFVPLRIIFESLGASVDYNGDGTIVATKAPHVIKLAVGSSTASASGEVRRIDAPPFVSGQTVMVPLRFVSESLDAVVGYDASRHTVTVWQEAHALATVSPGSVPAPIPQPVAPQVLIDDRNVTRIYGRKDVRDGRVVFIPCPSGQPIAIAPGMRVADWPSGICNVREGQPHGPGPIPYVPDTAPTAAPAPNPSQYYEVTARNSGKALDVNGGPSSTADGARIQQWAYVGATNQQWQFVPDSSGGYVIVARNSGKALDILDDRRDDGTPLHQWHRYGGPSQSWDVRSVGDGYYEIVSKLTGLALDVTGGTEATADGAQLEQWHYVGNTNQQFRLTPVGPIGDTLRPTPASVQRPIVRPEPSSSP